MVDLKSMSKKKQAEYIWDYYKLHIIGGFAIIFIVVSIINSHFTKIDYVFNLTMIGNVIDENKKGDLEKQLTSMVVKKGEMRKQAIIDITPIDSSKSSDATMKNEYMQRFIAKMSVGELDVVILDKDMFKSFVKQNIFLRLDNISGLNLNSIKKEKIKAEGKDNNNVVYAINAEDIKIFKDMGFNTHNKVIGIISSCKQVDKATLVLRWLLK